jgi:hypothetical protein
MKNQNQLITSGKGKFRSQLINSAASLAPQLMKSAASLAPQLMKSAASIARINATLLRLLRRTRTLHNFELFTRLLVAKAAIA